MMKFKTFYFYLIFCELEHKQRSIALVAMKWATKLLKSEIEIAIFFKSVDIFSEQISYKKIDGLLGFLLFCLEEAQKVNKWVNNF